MNHFDSPNSQPADSLPVSSLFPRGPRGDTATSSHDAPNDAEPDAESGTTSGPHADTYTDAEPASANPYDGDGGEDEEEADPLDMYQDDDDAYSWGALHTVRTAALHFGIDEATLREQCKNAARGRTHANLGGGIIAFKAGETWRIRFPEWQ